MMIFKRKRIKPELIDHASIGTIAGCSDNGWIESHLFMEWIHHFAKYTKCSKQSPVLDGHSTHTKNLELINFAHELINFVP